MINSACDKLRRDGLGVQQYMEEISWLLFLKALERTDLANKELAGFEGTPYEPIVPEAFEWSQWAMKPEPSDPERKLSGEAKAKLLNAPRFEGDNLYAFLTKPDGLFATLSKLSGTPERESVAEIFGGLGRPRSVNGTNLYDVIGEINKLDFHSAQDMYALGTIYEELLQETGKAGGFAGEFYTPRPVVRFMVEMVDPKPGEHIYDGAMGTGGFLISAFEHMIPRAGMQVQGSAREKVKGTFFGVEKNPHTYLLGQMNMLLHGVPEPSIKRENTLEKHLELAKDKRDVILANPPFGGKEHARLSRNFSHETAATEVLFMQHFMRALKDDGRAAVVTPNGFLFGDGVTAKVKRELLEGYNLHTIVRLPNGVFAPYTSIPTNLLFFTRGEPTKTIWYYQLPLPEGYKNFTKTKPIQNEHFDDVRAWWGNRQENAQAWRYDFKAAVLQAEKEARPYQDAASQALHEAAALLQQAQELETALKPLAALENMSPDRTTRQEIADLRAQLKLKKADEKEQRALAGEETAKANAILWAVYNLDRKHPDSQEDLEHLPPEELVNSILAKEQRIAEIMREIEAALGEPVVV